MLARGGKVPIGPKGETLQEAALLTMEASNPSGRAAKYARHFASTAPTLTTAFSRLAHYRSFLRQGGASSDLIDAAKLPSISRAYNTMVRNTYFDDGVYYDGDPSPADSPVRRGRGTGAADAAFPQRDDARRKGRTVVIPQGMDYDSILSRLESYDTSEDASAEGIIDTMIALSARPCELMNLDIQRGEVLGYAKSRRDEPRRLVSMLGPFAAATLLQWAQISIADGAVPDPGTLSGSRAYRRLLAPMGLALKDLRVLGAEYAMMANTDKWDTDAKKMAWRRAALRHDPRSVSAAESYAIVRPRRVSGDGACFAL